jgi:hypothetical protein
MGPRNSTLPTGADNSGPSAATGGINTRSWNPAEFLLPDHHGPWTLDDVLALPEDHSQRVEPADGSWVVNPPGDYRHQHLIGSCFAAPSDAARRTSNRPSG